MKIIQYYVADDGMKFETIEECASYEKKKEKENSLNARVYMLNEKGYRVKNIDKALFVLYQSDEDARDRAILARNQGDNSAPFINHPQLATKGIYIWDDPEEQWYKLDDIENFINIIKARFKIIQANPDFNLWPLDFKWPLGV